MQKGAAFAAPLNYISQKLLHTENCPASIGSWIIDNCDIVHYTINRNVTKQFACRFFARLSAAHDRLCPVYVLLIFIRRSDRHENQEKVDMDHIGNSDCNPWNRGLMGKVLLSCDSRRTMVFGFR